MSIATLRKATIRSGSRLGYAYLRRAALFFGLLNICLSLTMQNGIAYAAGGVVPWILLRIIGTPSMPAAVSYLFLWQWLQIFARACQAEFDGEMLSSGVYGVDVTRAYWYMLASLVVTAIGFRLVLAGSRQPTREDFGAHGRWRASDLMIVYLVAVAVSIVLAFGSRAMPSLYQPFDVASRIKVVALFVLCAYTLTTGRGMQFMLGAVFFEILVGFTGFFSDFRGAFIYLAIAAIASRVRWSAVSTLATVFWAALLLVMALFWTSVKNDYRIYASQSEDSQEIKVPLGERMAYLGNKVTSADGIDWSDAAYKLLIRLAYVDIFGAVIGVQELSPEPESYRQWSEALEHVFKPRFLFPDKASLSDSDVFLRLARSDPNEQVRAGTSISVGYMGESFADFGFPGMLAAVFVLGTAMGLIVRYFMSFSLPYMVREGIVMGFAISMGRDGVEVSLAKVLGGAFMFLIVFSLIAKFGFPPIVRWLDSRSAAA